MGLLMLSMHLLLQPQLSPLNLPTPQEGEGMGEEEGRGRRGMGRKGAGEERDGHRVEEGRGDVEASFALSRLDLLAPPLG